MFILHVYVDGMIKISNETFIRFDRFAGSIYTHVHLDTDFFLSKRNGTRALAQLVNTSNKF